MDIIFELDDVKESISIYTLNEDQISKTFLYTENFGHKLTLEDVFNFIEDYAEDFIDVDKLESGEDSLICLGLDEMIMNEIFTSVSLYIEENTKSIFDLALPVEFKYNKNSQVVDYSISYITDGIMHLDAPLLSFDLNKDTVIQERIFLSDAISGVSKHAIITNELIFNIDDMHQGVDYNVQMQYPQ